MWPVSWSRDRIAAAMDSMGSSLAPEQIYSTAAPSLKDAVVLFGGGCTGEIVSPQGLLLTNHHCGYSTLQELSTVQNDYLTDGFWAASFSEELPAPGLEVSFLVSMEDVTARLKSLEDSLRAADARQSARNVLLARYRGGAGDHAELVPMFERNRTFLCIYRTYRDVRLVGAPPSSIGKFGGETDNWMWPRHTGDFSFFRVYASPQGQPADYNPGNVPLHTPVYLSVSQGGTRPGDFVFIMGFPGSTSRYIPSFVMENLRDVTHPVRVAVRADRLRIMERFMGKSTALRLMYADTYVSLANYYKNSQAHLEAFRREDLVSARMLYEEELRAWVEQDSVRKSRYGTLLDDYREIVLKRRPLIRALQMYAEAFMLSPGVLDLATSGEPFYRAMTRLEGVSGQEHSLQQRTGDSLLQQWSEHVNVSLSRMDLRAECRILQSVLQLLFEQLPAEYLPDSLATDMGASSIRMKAYIRNIFRHSLCLSKVRREAFLAHPTREAWDADPLVQLSRAITRKYVRMSVESSRTRLPLDDFARRFMALQMEQDPDRFFYPDANGTMRLTFGNVDGYTPPGGEALEPYTYLTGVMDKERRRDPEFRVPSRLRSLYRQGQFGPYVEDGDVPVCFLSTTDIIGGNSGSPVMNARGELVGVAFDGNWEGAVGDLVYDPSFNRTISVDIRYVLFVVDKFAGAERLLGEMKIVR